ncbi:hypothetical protein A7981_01705 [Methylovorus sp. MM2]|uniref:response regulator transcription factor n=1 Tax=Methylovorus sp. MM2 TaxID=1848038 RepID=UPI0007DED7E9|nr:response regulator transcription factor [Methylovorus sp. MM2]OAM52230.1 hypothetical protein A7981_01705 [Methylovorus sp. MM2]
MPYPVSVCLVEDDEDLREEMFLGLREHNFDVRGFSGSRELYRDLLHKPADIIILDIGLPGEDGFSIAEHLRVDKHIGIIMLTARNMLEDRLRGLHGGADIYLVKPVELKELAANILNLAKRIKLPPRPENTTQWRLDNEGWFLISPHGKRIAMTASERTLVNMLVRQPGITISREKLIEALGHRREADYYHEHRLDMLFSRLRKKVAKIGIENFPMIAVRGVGYTFAPDHANP